MVWNAISNTDTETILLAIRVSSFLVTFFEPMYGGYPTMTGYVSERSGDAVATQAGGRWNIGFDISEY